MVHPINQMKLVSATPFNTPSAPQNLQATGHIGNLTLSWQVPNDDGSPITGCEIERLTDSVTT